MASNNSDCNNIRFKFNNKTVNQSSSNQRLSSAYTHNIRSSFTSSNDQQDCSVHSNEMPGWMDGNSENSGVFKQSTDVPNQSQPLLDSSYYSTQNKSFEKTNFDATQHFNSFYYPSQNLFPPNVCPPLNMQFPYQNPSLEICPQQPSSSFPRNLQSPTTSYLPPQFSVPAALPFINSINTSLPPANGSTFLPPTSIYNNEDKDPKVWLANHNILLKKMPAIKPTNITIGDYKTKVVNLMAQIKQLEKLTTHLQIVSKSLKEEEWFTRKDEVEKQKIAVQNAIDDLKIIPLIEIKSLLKKRKSKRKRLKRKKEEYKEAKRENKVLCQLEHSRIDLWLEKMKEQVERSRREEDIKKQADYVLSEVFHKKSEAKRVLSLLTTLGKLRNARINDRESKGEFVSKEAASTFNSIIEKLKKHWLNQINGYNMEEQGLRVMLNDAEVKRSNIEKSISKQILQQWLNIIFGEQNKNNNVYHVTNTDQLINVRKTWDQFICSSAGSNMPVGWVLPTPPTNEMWAKFLKS